MMFPARFGRVSVIILEKAGQRYPKPVFQGGWRKYVRAKRLTPGDKIIFRVEENGVPTCTIAAKRKIKLFGKTIGWSVEF